MVKTYDFFKHEAVIAEARGWAKQVLKNTDLQHTKIPQQYTCTSSCLAYQVASPSMCMNRSTVFLLTRP